MNHIFRQAIENFLDEYEERKYLFRLKIEGLTIGFLKARQPVYLYNNGWND